jgi:hypothetical protein
MWNKAAGLSSKLLNTPPRPPHGVGNHKLLRISSSKIKYFFSEKFVSTIKTNFGLMEVHIFDI